LDSPFCLKPLPGCASSSEGEQVAPENMQLTMAPVVLCVSLSAAAMLLSGCGKPCDAVYDNSAGGQTRISAKDKKGMKVIVTQVWYCGKASDSPTYWCPDKDLPKKDGYVRQSQKFKYKGDKPLKFDVANLKFEFKSTHGQRENALDFVLPGECQKTQVREYKTCQQQGCPNSYYPDLIEKNKNVPVKDAGGCCEKKGKKTTTLYHVIGVLRSSVVTTAGATFAAGMLVAMVLGLGVVTRRVLASRAMAPPQALIVDTELE